MIIGGPKEIQKDEYRVALLPVGVELLTKDGRAAAISMASHKLVNQAVAQALPDLPSA